MVVGGIVVVGGSVISSTRSDVGVGVTLGSWGVGESLTKDFVVVTLDVAVGGIIIDVVMMLAFMFDNMSF